MTVFLVLIPRMDKRINRTDLCMHARSSFPLTCSDTLDLCTLSCLCRSNRPDLCEVYATLLLLRLLLVRASFSCIHQYSCSFIHYANLVQGQREIDLQRQLIQKRLELAQEELDEATRLPLPPSESASTRSRLSDKRLNEWIADQQLQRTEQQPTGGEQPIVKVETLRQVDLDLQTAQPELVHVASQDLPDRHQSAILDGMATTVAIDNMAALATTSRSTAIDIATADVGASARWENNFKNRSRASQSARSRGCTGFVFACTTAIEGCACITAQPKKKMSPGVQRSITALSLSKQWRPLKRRTFPCFSGWIAAPGQS